MLKIFYRQTEKQRQTDKAKTIIIPPIYLKGGIKKQYNCNP